jgi:hypothetical protein
MWIHYQTMMKTINLQWYIICTIGLNKELNQSILNGENQSIPSNIFLSQLMERETYDFME